MSSLLFPHTAHLPVTKGHEMPITKPPTGFARERAFKQRRELLIAAASAVPSALALPASGAQKNAPRASANEDLMQEHGLVERIILIYGRTIELLNANQGVDLALAGQASQIVSRVIHAHHEVEEERIIFPVVEKTAGMQTLTSTLRGQHSAARAITAVIGRNAGAEAVRNAARRKELITAMQNFMNMYTPHGAHEDTEVYPAFREALTHDEYAKVAEQFAADEQRVNQAGGFGENVRALRKIEAALGMELSRYTRQMESPVDAASAGTKK
jgi:hemerythrin-like domain-containing protein